MVVISRWIHELRVLAETTAIRSYIIIPIAVYVVVGNYYRTRGNYGRRSIADDDVIQNFHMDCAVEIDPV